MAGLERITQPTLDVLEVLVRAFEEEARVHGWAIMKLTGRAGPTVYKVLDRLEKAGWITGEREQLAPTQAGPRRRFYRLTGGRSGGSGPSGATPARRGQGAPRTRLRPVAA